MEKQGTGSHQISGIRFETVRWSIFVILILSYILVYFQRMAPGVVSEFLMADFQTTGTRLGSLSAIYFFVYAVMQIPSGVIADTLGTRTSIVSGNLTAGVGSLVFGMADTFEMACAGRFLVGLGVSVIFVSIMKSHSVWFREKIFGMMSGLTLLIGNLGSILAAAPLAMLLTLLTWRSIFMGIGFISLALSVLGYFMVRNRPEDLGFESPNQYKKSEMSQTLSSSWAGNLKHVLAEPRLWPGFCIQFGMVGALYSFMGLWGIPYLRDVHGLSREYAADHITVMLLSFAVGSLLFGWFSDRIGRRKPLLIFSVTLYAVSWLITMYVSWSPGIEGFLLLGTLGFSGSGFVLTFAAAKESVHPELSGMAVSVVNTGCFIGTALMQPLFGFLADRTWDGTMENGVRIYSATDYYQGFVAMLVFSIIAFAAGLKMNETYCRNRYA